MAGFVGTDRERQAVYSIGTVAKMLGVSPSTLRAWERRYTLVVPARSAGSQRLYSPLQVEQLRFVLRSLGNGVRAADAHRLLAQQLAGHRHTFTGEQHMNTPGGG